MRLGVESLKILHTASNPFRPKQPLTVAQAADTVFQVGLDAVKGIL